MHDHPSAVADPLSPTGLHLLYPLNEFYEQAGIEPPPAVLIDGAAMREPYRTLLVHNRDMTPALEGYYGRSMTLRVLKYALDDDVFSRQIVLLPEGSSLPVVFGAIKIYLDHFPPEARRLVLERKLPFGTILHSQGIEHSSRPDAYFEVAQDAVIAGALQLAPPSRCAGAARLYGRRNVLRDASQRKLAQVLEILPPVVNSSSERIHD